MMDGFGTGLRARAWATGGSEFPTYIHRYSVILLPQENSIRSVRFVALGRTPVVVDRRLLIRTGRDRVGQEPQCARDGLATAMAELAQA